jgi:hypothetical protein
MGMLRLGQNFSDSHKKMTELHTDTEYAFSITSEAATDNNGAVCW